MGTCCGKKKPKQQENNMQHQKYIEKVEQTTKGDFQFYNNPIQPFSICIFALIYDNSLNFDDKLIDIFNQGQEDPDFVQINPLKKVPAIKHGNYVLTESSAILRYLTRTQKIQTSVYPYEDGVKCFYIDQLLSWMEINAIPFFNEYTLLYVQAKKKLKQVDDKVLNDLLQKSKAVLTQLLKMKKETFMAGPDVTLCDYFLFGLLLPVVEIAKLDLNEFVEIKKWYTIMSSKEGCKKTLEKFLKEKEKI